MKRRDFIKYAASGIALAAVSRERVRGAEFSAQPNVVYLFSDEHRWQSMSFTEMPELHTPNMAAMAAQGAEFTHTISNYPVCSPHRAMLMTSRWPYQQGVTDNDIHLSPDEITLGKVFKAAGYRTGYIGKWHLGGRRAEPFGFDLSLIWNFTWFHRDKARYHPAGQGPVCPKGYNATLMTDQALAFIHENAGASKPFFLMVGWDPPHAIFEDAPDEKKALYPEGSLLYRPNVDQSVKGSAKGRVALVRKRDSLIYRGYHAHITAIDEELGRVLKALDDLKLTRDTIVVYSSDHGTMFGSHGLKSKRQPYEESIRVPFLVRWPGIVPAGLKNHALFGSIDIMPTLCGLAGVDIPSTCEGQDFSPALLGKDGPDPDFQPIMHISEKNSPVPKKYLAPLFRGVRTKRYTYAITPDGKGFLFDNQKDPYQLMNLFGNPDMADIRKQLEALTRQWLKKARDPFVIPE
ncbi:MAG: sulfatase [Candidatus Hydrogenedentota bacterium]